MKNRGALLLRAIQEEPWAITPAKLEAIAAVVGERAGLPLEGIAPAPFVVGEKREPEVLEGAALEAAAGGGTVTTGKIALLPFYGVVAQRMTLMMEMSGGTSTEQFAAAFRAAVGDDAIDSILIDVDSPGGSVFGVQELSEEIRAARGRKPIIAIANSQMASAAYWIGSAADEIVASPGADVGSIGVYALHIDQSRQLEEEGVTPTFLYAGRYKVEGNSYEPLGDEAREHFQEKVDARYQDFIAGVAKNRGLKKSQVVKEYGEGRSYPAREALARGMVDRIATREQVIERLSRRRKGSAPGRMRSVSLERYR